MGHAEVWSKTCMADSSLRTAPVDSQLGAEIDSMKACAFVSATANAVMSCVAVKKLSSGVSVVPSKHFEH